MRTLIFIILGLTNAVAQVPDSAAFQEQLAFTFDNAEQKTEDTPFELDAEWEGLADLWAAPLNINTVSVAALERLPFLSETQRAAIVAHRQSCGLYMDVLELQSVLDAPTLALIKPFVYCDQTFDGFKMPLSQWFLAGEHRLVSRSVYRIEQAKGFTHPFEAGGFEGGRGRLYARWRYRFNHRLSYGLTLEKDAGETLKRGFASAHFMLADVSARWQQVVIGDFALCLGQGLIFDNGFGLGKSSGVLNIQKNTPTLRPYASANEHQFLRGIGLKYGFSARTEGVLAVSFRQYDGNIRLLEDGQSAVSSLSTSGWRRTSAEIADQKAVAEWLMAGRLVHRSRHGQWGMNAVFHHFSRPIMPQTTVYNGSYFRGQRLLNVSFDHKYYLKNHVFFGEIAASDNLGWALIQGWQWTWGKGWAFGLLHRHFSLTYQALGAQAFAESGRLNDELGWYWGIEYQHPRRWRLSAYTDVWRHRAWRFRVSAPSEGYEFLLKYAYESRKKPFSIQFRWKSKPENAPIESLATPQSALVWAQQKVQARVQGQWPISTGWVWRWRIDGVCHQTPTATTWGLALMHDLVFTPPQYPLYGSLRWAFFDTEGFDTAIYAYENDLRNTFTVLPYYEKGQRFYINLGYKGAKKWLAEARLSRTLWQNKRQSGSGADLIQAPHRTDISVQLSRAF